MMVRGFAGGGYDYATINGSDFNFPTKPTEHRASMSLNDTGLISDRPTFEAYPWPDAEKCDYSRLEALKADLAPRQKLLVCGPGGVLENAMAVVGYENLCLMLSDDPELARDVIDAVGCRMLRYYEICADYDAVGALISNDDWGFATQTMLSPADLHKYVFPWHRKIAAAIHAAGKPALLHSCGQLEAVMDAVIDDLKFDGKHSYEDKIIPVEEAYERWGSRIAILGGIDVDFVCRSEPEEIRRRCRAMLDRSATRGGYALGTGNSVPEYVPQEKYRAMISVVD